MIRKSYICIADVLIISFISLTSAQIFIVNKVGRQPPALENTAINGTNVSKINEFPSWRALIDHLEYTITRLGTNLPEPGQCGNVISNPINGDNVIKINEFPWIALIQYEKDGNSVGFRCIGSLINNRYILTAAKCIIELPGHWKPFRVRLGEWNTSTDQDCEVDTRGIKNCADSYIDVTIEKLIRHENYAHVLSSRNNDIGLIRLSRYVDYTDYIRPICLPLDDILKESTFDGHKMYFYGEIAYFGHGISRKSEVPVVPLNECKTLYSQNKINVGTSQICAGRQIRIYSGSDVSSGSLIGLDSSNKQRVYNFIAGIESFWLYEIIVNNYGQCITPNAERALCIEWEQCTELYNWLTTRNPLSDADRNFLQLSQCGSNDGKVLICCPERQILFQPPAPNNTETKLGTNLPEPGHCGNVISNPINGDNVTKINEFPWMALIEYEEDGKSIGHQSLGSLINNRYVLTAAQCISSIPKTWKPFRVRLGEWNTTTDQDCEVDTRGGKNCADPHIDVTIEKVIPHEKFVHSFLSPNNDIGLIRLSRYVDYTDYIRPICLPLKDILKQSTFDGQKMYISGWGKTIYHIRRFVKRKAEVPVVPFNECKRLFSLKKVDIGTSQICAGGQKGIDSCRGEAGGPLIGLDSSNKQRAYNFIAGIVSFGANPCGQQGWPGVYTRVGYYVDWIKQNIEP